MKNKNFKLIIFFAVIAIGAIVAIISSILIYNTQPGSNSQSNQAIIEIKTIPNNGEATTKKRYYVIHANQKVTKTKKFTPDKAKVTNVDPSVFEGHEGLLTGRLHISVTKPNIYKKKDKNLNSIIKAVAKVSHHEFDIFTIFKLHGHYYAYAAINAGISDDSYFYRFYPKSHKLKQLCHLEEGEIIGIKELK